MFKKNYIDYLVGIEKETQFLPVAKNILMMNPFIN